MCPTRGRLHCRSTDRTPTMVEELESAKFSIQNFPNFPNNNFITNKCPNLPNPEVLGIWWSSSDGGQWSESKSLDRIDEISGNTGYQLVFHAFSQQSLQHPKSLASATLPHHRHGLTSTYCEAQTLEDHGIWSHGVVEADLLKSTRENRRDAPSHANPGFCKTSNWS